MLEPFETEGISASVYRLAGHDEIDPPGPIVLARRLLGPTAVQRVPSQLLHGEASLVRLDTGYRLYVAQCLSPARLGFAVAHELGHWMCERMGYGDADIEAVCDAIAAAIVVPQVAFRMALGCGYGLRELARGFVVSESCIALRIGETTGRSLALVTPRRVRVRGQEYAWPPRESDFRRLVCAETPGIRRLRLEDEPGRALLLPDRDD